MLEPESPPAGTSLLFLPGLLLVLLAASFAEMGCRDCRGSAPEDPAEGAPAVPASRATTSEEKGRGPAAEVPAQEGPRSMPEILVEDFRQGPLDPRRWVPTRLNDFQASSLEVMPDPQEPGDGRLRFRAATIGTRHHTVKYLGVAHPRPIDLRHPVEIEIEIDWAHQSNGSYLTLGFYLSPKWSAATASRHKDWLSFRFVGIPPGKTARAELMRRTHGNLQVVERFGWPKVKSGRDLGRATVTLSLDGRSLSLSIDGKEQFSTPDAGFRFDRAYLFLEMSTHSNYPRRELFIDRVKCAARFFDESAIEQQGKQEGKREGKQEGKQEGGRGPR